MSYGPMKWAIGASVAVFALFLYTRPGLRALHTAVPVSQAADWIILSNEADWSPKLEQVTRAREIVKGYLLKQLQEDLAGKGNGREIRKILSHWSEFNVQVVGKFRGTRPVIHLNFLHGNQIDWRRDNLILVSDGGWNFWSVDVNLTRNEAEALSINGYA